MVENLPCLSKPLKQAKYPLGAKTDPNTFIPWDFTPPIYLYYLSKQ